MKRLVLVAVIAWMSVGLLAARQAGRQDLPPPTALPPLAAPTATAPAEYRAMVTRYCVGCHNQRANIPAGAPLHLDRADLDHVAADAAVWEKVIRKLGVGAMPPQGAPQPDAAVLNGFRDYLIDELGRAADEANNPGHFTLHRLNRTEYANAIRDLLDLDVDMSGLLPSDSSDAGFDNVVTALKTTPSLLDRYLTAAIRISELAVGKPDVQPADYKFPVRFDLTQKDHIEGLPLGTRGGTVIRFNFPADGEYILSGALFRPADSADTGIETQDVPAEFQILVDGVTVHTALVGGLTDHAASRENLTAANYAVAARMKVRVPVTAGPHDVGFTFVESRFRSRDIFQPALREGLHIHGSADLAKLTAVTISGPIDVTGISDTPSRKRLFVCRPANATEETGCARQILGTVARRAYRRPVTEAELESVMTFYQQARKTGDFEAGIRAALPRILASPSFLFRSESDPVSMAVNTPHPTTDLELASRLSFFLWSSIPDDELLDVAIRGRLRAPGVLEQQVRRMLADERSSALTTNFPDQWLALRNMENVAPDLLTFPNWDLNVRQALQRETQLFFDSIVREDRSALDLLNADYTFLNERLARHYGIPGVFGTAFRRVKVSDPNRHGLLGHGSILALTSVATRTSPVFRGKWILTHLLNTPPLPPPPNVPALADNAVGAAPKSVRERLEAHRANPVCASCHRSMDPIGFALENFDAVGQWRATTEAGGPVDASGVLMDGTPIDGPVALRKALTSRPTVFVGTLTENLLIYALGRGLETYDMPVVRQIVRDAGRNDYRMMSIIMGIVSSRPFQMRVKTPAVSAE